LPFDTFLI